MSLLDGENIPETETRIERRAPVDEGAQVMALFQQAIDKGTTVESLSQLVALHERVQRRRAELEFASNLVEFQTECPPIPKSSKAKIVTSSGTGFEYTFADFEQIVETIRPHLARHGLSFTFDSKTDGRMLTCTCTVRHANGHAVSSSFTLPADSKSAMSEQQKMGAALTFAKRQSLTAALGLSLTDAVPVDEAPAGAITEEQAATLEAILTEVGASRDRFLRYFDTDKIAGIAASQFSVAVRMLEEKRKGARRGA